MCDPIATEARRILAADKLRAAVGLPRHTCEAAYEDATTPTRGGAITVTVRCLCGQAVETYQDGVL